MRFGRLALCSILSLLTPIVALAQDQDGVEIVEQRKIWDYAAHNAFTSLVKFNAEWYCAFREGNKHASPDGAIRILTSGNEEQWNVAARLANEHADLRDPKLTVTPDNRLMLTATAATPGKPVTHRTMVWFSEDGKQWGDPKPIGEDNVWLWGVTWNGDTAYGVGYSTDARAGEPFIRLYRSADGLRWETVVDKLLTKDFPNESSLTFDPDGTAHCLVRRDGGKKTAMLGEAKAPYTEWTWKDCGVQIGGPAMTRKAVDGTLIAVVRLYDNATRTAVCRIDPADGSVTELASFESGCDTGYAGVVCEGNVLWASFYSSHEGKASIYFAKVFLTSPEPNGPFLGAPGLYGRGLFPYRYGGGR